MGVHAEIYAAFQSRWADAMPLAAIVPAASVFTSSVPEDFEGYPRAVITQVEGGETQFSTGRVTVDDYTFEVMVWSKTLASADSVVAPLRAAFAGSSWIRLTGADSKITGCRREGPVLVEQVDPEDDVWLTSAMWTVGVASSETGA